VASVVETDKHSAVAAYVENADGGKVVAQAAKLGDGQAESTTEDDMDSEVVANGADDVFGMTFGDALDRLPSAILHILKAFAAGHGEGGNLGAEPTLKEARVEFSHLFHREAIDFADIHFGESLFYFHRKVVHLGDGLSGLAGTAERAGIDGDQRRRLQAAGKRPGLKMTCLVERDIETAKSEAVAVAGSFAVAS
jgi:hypothetical protein